MLSNDDIQRLSVSKKDKLYALFNVLSKIDEADCILDDVVYRHMPFSEDTKWLDEAAKYFWNSECMQEINDVSRAIGNARSLVHHAIHALETTKI